MEAAWGHVLKLRCCPDWGDRFQSLTDTVMLTRSQNMLIQEQRVNTGFAPYDGLITHLQNTFLPSSNSALSKLNLFPQERRPSTGIHNPGPTESDPRLATLQPPRVLRTRAPEEDMDVFCGHYHHRFSTGLRSGANQSPFFPKLFFLSKAYVRVCHCPAGNGFPFYLE